MNFQFIFLANFCLFVFVHGTCSHAKEGERKTNRQTERLKVGYKVAVRKRDTERQTGIERAREKTRE